MAERKRAVRQAIVMREESGGPLSSVWLYHLSDPWALTLQFPTEFPKCSCLYGCDCGPIRWTFGRDLLAAGLRDEAGDGDVQVRPHLDRVAIRLQSVNGSAVITAPAQDLRRFLRRTYGLVPAGAEPAFLDVDTVVAKLLAGRP